MSVAVMENPLSVIEALPMAKTVPFVEDEGMVSEGDTFQLEKQEVNEREVISLPGLQPEALEGAVESRGLIGTGYTYRHFWGYKRGTWNLYLHWPVVNANSRIFVSITEGHLGSAPYQVLGVAPFNNWIGVKVNIGWHYNIRLFTSYLVINP